MPGSDTRTSDAARAPRVHERNAQHGQNRAGVEVEAARPFEDFESRAPIDPAAADACIADEGDEIRQRVHARGHDVMANTK